MHRNIRTALVATLAVAALTAGMGTAAADYPSTGSFAIDEVNNGSSTLRQFPLLAGSGNLLTGSALGSSVPALTIVCAVLQVIIPKACVYQMPNDPDGPK
ncbi:hypothetical protein [Nocardia inohanensis]|uniref:hypothetical protein n=1 Tax=Nocardia inohanensis TaxID=209246 RepID=UPI00083022FE|nr:hypothetical protein [Nocardia inohanensis]